MTRKIIDIYDNLGDNVEVYRNLKRSCWSVRSTETKKVISHCRAIALNSCSYHITRKQSGFIRGKVSVYPQNYRDYEPLLIRHYNYVLKNGDSLSKYTSGGTVALGMLGMYIKDYFIQGNFSFN